MTTGRARSGMVEAGIGGGRVPWWHLPLLLILLCIPLALPLPVAAAPGLCVGPVCGDQITRSALYPWQLRLRIEDQRGHRERIVVDCRQGAISPANGPVERGYATALVRRACRLTVPEAGA